MNIKKRLMITLGFVVCVAIIQVFAGRYITLASVQSYAHDLHLLSQQYYSASASVLIALFVLCTLFGIPLTVLLTVVAGYLFGIASGMVYSLCGSVGGGAVLFLLTRSFLGQAIQKRYALELQDFNQQVHRHGHYYMLMLQLFPFTPTFFINVGAGLTHISLWTYIWTNAVGMVPGTYIYVAAGRQLHSVDGLSDIMSTQFMVLFGAFALLFLIPIVWQWWSGKKV